MKSVFQTQSSCSQSHTIKMASTAPPSPSQRLLAVFEAFNCPDETCDETSKLASKILESLRNSDEDRPNCENDDDTEFLVSVCALYLTATEATLVSLI